jgi:TPR repeat protein
VLWEIGRFISGVSDPHLVVKKALLRDEETSGVLEMFDKNDYRGAFLRCKLLADLGNPIAQNNLGVFFETGTGTERNDGEAERYYRMAAEHEVADAQFNLSAILCAEILAEQCTAPHDQKEAKLTEGLHWAKKAREAGQPAAKAAERKIAASLRNGRY